MPQPLLFRGSPECRCGWYMSTSFKALPALVSNAGFKSFSFAEREAALKFHARVALSLSLHQSGSDSVGIFCTQGFDHHLAFAARGKNVCVCVCLVFPRTAISTNNESTTCMSSSPVWHRKHGPTFELWAATQCG
eukprot:5007050-Amphidinium_carterae.1